MAADILYIDDEPEQLIRLAEKAGAEDRFSVYDVNQLDEVQSPPPLPLANAWVLDFYNDEKARGSGAFGDTKSTGLSVFQGLRLLAGERRPPAILISNHLESALGQPVLPRLRHRLAEQVGVEWVAEKDPDGDRYLVEILAIADATSTFQAVAEELSKAAAEDYLAVLADRLLAMPNDAPWAPLAINDLDNWRPPSWRDEVANDGGAVDRINANARPFVAWMIRQVLAYPGVLIGTAHIAARLDVSTASLKRCFEAGDRIGQALGERLYRGVLDGLYEPRWWAAGVDEFVFGLPRASDERRDLLLDLSAGKLEFLNLENPVVVSNADLVETDAIASADDCVRASDADAPSHAPPSWILKDEARRDKALARRVWLDDLPGLALA